MIVTTLAAAYHTGTLKGRPKERSSFEGPLLSCAEDVDCMDAWQLIARLGDGPCWELRLPNRKSFRLVVWQKLTKTDQKNLLIASLNAGLAAKAEIYHTCFFDKENEEERHFAFELKTEAEDELLEHEDDATARIEPIQTFRPSTDIFKWWCSSLDPCQWEEALILHQLESESSIHGIYWADRFDPCGLSAPRVGLFERVVPTLMRKRLRA